MGNEIEAPLQPVLGMWTPFSYVYWRTLRYEQTNMRKWADVISRSCARMIIILPAGFIRNEKRCYIQKGCVTRRYSTKTRIRLCRCRSVQSDLSLCCLHTHLHRPWGLYRHEMKVLDWQPSFTACFFVLAVCWCLKPPYSMMRHNMLSSVTSRMHWNAVGFSWIEQKPEVRCKHNTVLLMLSVP